MTSSGVRTSNGCSVPGHDRTPARMAASRAAVLLPIIAMTSGDGPMNVRPASLAGAREGGVLGEEPVSRMDGVGARAPGRVDDRLDAQIALGRLAGPDVHRLIRFTHVAGAAIAVGEDGDRRDAHFPARPHDPDRDFAAVGDQDFHEAARPEEGADRIVS